MNRPTTIKFFFLMLFYCNTSIALDIHVTNYNDSFYNPCTSNCSLREAIELANNTPGEDRIFLKNDASSIYRLSRPVQHASSYVPDEDRNKYGDLDITDDLIIEGEYNNGNVIIDADRRSRILDIRSGTVKIYNVTFTKGLTTFQGGAIENFGNLTMHNCNVTQSMAVYRGGGGIANHGVLNFYFGEISENSTRGGNIFTNSLNYPAEGAGIYNDGTLNIRNATIQKNVHFDKASIMGGGLFNKGKADIRRSLFFQNSVSTTMNVNSNGLAILNVDRGALKLVSTTVAGHQASINNAGIGAVIANGDTNYNFPLSISLSHVTIADNTALGFVNMADAYIHNSIIAGNGNGSMTELKNCFNWGGIIFGQGLLLGQDNGFWSCPTDLPAIPYSETFTSVLEPLTDLVASDRSYLGPTLGFALKPQSIAIDAGGFDCPLNDQINSTAAQDGDNDSISTCDLGAIEYQP